MGGQFRVRGRLGHIATVFLGKDSGRRFGWHERNMFVLVDDDPLEQRPVEDAAFSRLALAVEVTEVGEDTDDLIEPLVSAVVGGREAVEAIQIEVSE